MTAPPSRSIAILVDQCIDYSTTCMQNALIGVNCCVDIVTPAALLSIYSTNDADIKPLHQYKELQRYDLVIYLYSDEFSTIRDWLDDYAGRLIVYYKAGVDLSNLRAFYHCASRVRQLEQARQRFCEWAQHHVKRAFWLADCEQSVRDLRAWGITNPTSTVDIVPAFIDVEPGLYSDQIKDDNREDGYILVAGPFVPSTGHKKAIDVIARYQLSASQGTILQFTGTIEPNLEVYMEEIKQYAITSGVDCHFNVTTTPVAETTCFLQACVMLQLDSGSACANVVKAQAMGLPVLTVSKTDSAAESAQLLLRALHDSATKDLLVLNGYRTVYEQYSQQRIEQLFISSVFAALNLPSVT